MLVGSLDYESVTSYTLIVKATDKGAPALSSQITFTIKVTDVNDNKPVFKPDVYDKTIPENSDFGTTIVIVTASDDDSKDDGKVIYTIVSGNEKGLVKINMVSKTQREKNLFTERYSNVIFLTLNRLFCFLGMLGVVPKMLFQIPWMIFKVCLVAVKFPSCFNPIDFLVGETLLFMIMHF